ncbi:MAG: ABC transporter permease [Bacteroidales bacterium]|nr:ABC transporter permease [Bacteroidales bacterium]MBN2698119.1 ABC transporter permease [Bacteroidales bacterium]
MNKVPLIIQREYLTRVRKKSFIIMSILGPFIFAAYVLIPMALATMEDKEIRTVAVIDDSRMFTSYTAEGPASVIPDREYIKFKILQDMKVEDLQDHFEETGYYALLFIPENIFASETSIIYSTKQTSIDVTEYIERAIEKEMENLKLAKHEIENIDQILQEVKTDVRVRNIKWTKEGESQETNTGVVMGVGYLAGLMIFFFIFFFGSQVMRGVIEEKISRIIEIIVSSVKPFQLMMGKIIGVGLTGLTQFIIWIVFSLILIVGIKTVAFPELNQTPTEKAVASELFEEGGNIAENAGQITQEAAFAEDIFNSLGNIDLAVMIGSFLFFFLFGYLLYAAMFAVIGSAVDNETDTQQFMWPVMLPLILAIYVMISAMQNPDGPLPFWFSMIPFTSPVVMMVRIPFGVPWWEVIVSGVLLIITFIGMTWVAGKIYRTGILMYGKKTTYRELWKWLRY